MNEGDIFDDSDFDFNFDDDEVNLGGSSGALEDEFDTLGNGSGNTSDSDGYSGENSSGADFDAGRLHFNNGESDSDDGDMSTSKISKIAVIAGIVGVILVIGVGAIIKNANSKKDRNNNHNQVVNTQGNSGGNYSGASEGSISTGANSSQTGSNQGNNKQSSSDEWSVITDKENIEFESDYKSAVYMITGIEHMAKVTGSNIVVKTRLTGSISGFSGVYELDVPYRSGVYLNIGDEFNVEILIGSFNGKNVIGDIRY